MSRHLPRAAGALLVFSCAAAQAQTAGQLAPVTVTGSPLGSSGITPPAEALSGPQLLLRSQSSLGETLNALPGVSSTYFGPTASRPVIRGLDGDRIRILGNGGALSDVSGVSYDHAVSADPIAVERIEVLRGPAALLYGGSAIGGVVNLIDNRIPREPAEGVTGKADAGRASGAAESSGALLVEGGTQRWALHADAFARESGDVRVPLSLACLKGGTPASARRICNSAAASEGGAAGGSLFFDGGYVGFSTSRFASRYGAVSEEASIRMRSGRQAVEGEFRKLPGWIEQLRIQGSYSDYRHEEEEGGVTGTVFRQRGTDLRVEARHRTMGPLTGVWGLQIDANRFSAEGEEAFAPPSRTSQGAVFALEEMALPWGKLTAGLRSESVRVRSSPSAFAPRFVAAGRSFTPSSAALGATWEAAPGWQLAAHLAYSQRAPKDYELFADGPHVATGAYEVGDPALGVERSRNVEASVQWTRGHHRVRLAAYASRFTDYITLSPTGAVTDGLPVFAYRATRAGFRGFEAAGNWRLHDGAGTLDLGWRADAVRAHDEVRGEPLARMPPLRIGADLTASYGPLSAMLGADAYARQSRVPAGAAPTPGYVLLRAAITRRSSAPGMDLLWYAKLDNAADRLAYSATSILTQTAPGRVPLPGRSLKLGVRAAF